MLTSSTGRPSSRAWTISLKNSRISADSSVHSAQDQDQYRHAAVQIFCRRVKPAAQRAPPGQIHLNQAVLLFQHPVEEHPRQQRHRVQRLPVTESQGRIQTSAAGVIVFPEADEDDDEIEIDQKDLKIDIFMSSGPGGQSVNTTYSAVRMTHIPTGIVVSMQDEKSQIQNRAAALRVLKSRLLAMKHEEEAAQAADMRHSQVRSLDRSERIRTYNFPENRIVDHRTNYKAYNLDAVLDGDLQAVIDSDIQADEADRLANQK